MNHEVGDNASDQRGLIITDDISMAPILDFTEYAEAIGRVIEKSYPKFSIGIYGDWGIGKTTLMRYIFNLLESNKNNSVIPVWFNAWRYEREEYFTLIPLLKTIELNLPSEYKDLKGALREAAIFGWTISKDAISSIVRDHFGRYIGDVTGKGLDTFTEKIIPELKKIDEIENHTIYFEGQEKIYSELKKLRDKKPQLKIVVFIDDLDRCSPEKILELFESTKVFLDMDGFIYVLGLNHKKVAKLITDKYGLEGEQYIKKIIQIPVNLQEWDGNDIKELIQHFLSGGLVDGRYRKIVHDNIDLISTAVEENPRETKRFLNNFIVAYEIYREKGLNPKELLILQTLNMRWNNLYLLVIGSQGKFLDEIEPYLNDRHILNQLSLKEEGETLTSREGVILQLRDDDKCWNFVKANFRELRQIKDWSYYRRATKASGDTIAIGGIVTLPLIAELEQIQAHIKELEESTQYSLSNEIRLRELRKRENQILKEAREKWHR